MRHKSNCAIGPARPAHRLRSAATFAPASHR